MTDRITVEVLPDEWTGYEGLKAALEKAIETLKDSALIRKVTGLMTQIENAYAYFERRDKSVKEISNDVDELRRKIDRL